MSIFIFIGIYVGTLGAGFSMLGVVYTLQQHGWREWKTALLFSLLSLSLWTVVAMCARQNELLNARHQDKCACKCEQCKCKDGK